MRMFRTNIYLEERQTEALDRIAKAQGVARAVLIRYVVDEALNAFESNKGPLTRATTKRSSAKSKK
jgi:hypothetical protein